MDLALIAMAWIAGARILKILSMIFYLDPTSTHVEEVQRNSERNPKEIEERQIMQRKSLVQLQGVKAINGVNVKHDSLAKHLSRQWLIL